MRPAGPLANDPYHFGSRFIKQSYNWDAADDGTMHKFWRSCLLLLLPIVAVIDFICLLSVFVECHSESYGPSLGVR